MRLSYRLLIYALFVAMFFAPWLLWISDPNLVRRLVYPIKGKLAAWSTTCSPNTPSWLEELTRQMAKAHDSPANQVVVSLASGELLSCFNGWESTPYISRRVTDETPMRLASLSKIVSFVGMTGMDKESRGHWLDSFLIDSLLVSALEDERVGRIRIRNLLNHSAGFDRHRTQDPITQFNASSWCPHDLRNLGKIRLDYTPATRFGYHNLDYCLAEAAYDQYFSRTLWDHLVNDLEVRKYGLEWLSDRDTPVTQNLMHEGLTGYGEVFLDAIDWEAARAPMGLTGNARGLARFIVRNKGALSIAKSMRDDSISCNDEVVGSCFDGFLNRLKVRDQVLWQQRGYLYGMSAVFILDENDNFIIWLGSGEGRPWSAGVNKVRKTFVENVAGTAPN